MSVNAGHPEVRKLVRRFKPGYSIRSNGHAKFVVVGPDGRDVRHPDGRPVGLPNSPGSQKAVQLMSGIRTELRGR